MPGWSAHNVLRSAAAAALSLLPACSADIFDVSVDLQTRVYTADFGAGAGSIPTLPCTPSDPGACGEASVVVGTAPPPGDQVSIACDDTTLRCYAQAVARTAVTVDVLMDASFTAKVERHGISFVRVADLAYTVPVNTLDFDLPAVSVYAGPADSAMETDPGVELVDTTAPVPAGATFTDAQHLTLADHTPARALIESSILQEQPFVLIFVVTPRLESGSPIPAGAVEIDLAPRILLGLPR